MSPIGTGSVNLNSFSPKLFSRETVVQEGKYNDGDKQFGVGSRIKDQTKFSTGVGMKDHDDNIMMTQWGKDNAVSEIKGAMSKQKGEVFLEVITGPGANDVGMIKFDMKNPADVAKLKQIANMIENSPNFKHLEINQGSVSNQDGEKFSQLPKAGGTYNINNASLVVVNQ